MINIIIININYEIITIEIWLLNSINEMID